MNTKTRRTSVTSSITLSVIAVLSSAAQAQTVTEWDLPGQPLASSLRDIAARSDSNIIFDKKLVVGQSAKPLKIKASTEEALSKVLEGTGLTYRQLDEKTVTIQLASADKGNATSYASNSDGRIRLAQAESDSIPVPRSTSQSGPSVMLLEEIVVTGTNIRGIENNTAPVTVLSREYIDATGYTTASRLLESVTQNFALTSQYGANVPGVSNGNTEQGSAVNLRGIGEGTTLVLLNGRRIAPGYRSASVDISALPLSAIERVEILPDGASALYGSDAVGGVVNFILRDDFKGAETRLRAGTADGINEYRGSQALGNSWDSGNALVSVEYYKRDLLKASDRDFVPNASMVGSLAPEDENMSAVITARQDLSGVFSVFADALYTDRESANRFGRVLRNEASQVDNTQGVATLGLDWNVAGDWQIELSGSYARNDIEQTSTSLLGTTVLTPNTQDFDRVFDMKGGEIKADGSLFSMPGGNVRFAIGGAYREETYEELSRSRQTGVVAIRNNQEQTIKSGFGELYVPLVGKDNAMAGVQRLELSLAGRYDEYSDAGSSFDPQAGIMWEPVTGFRLRGRYSTSYKAPNLVDYSPAANLTTVQTLAGQGVVMVVAGTAVDSLSPQESKNTSFGLEFTPEALPGFSLALNYYDIEYTGLIANPAVALVILNNPAVYGQLITRNPSLDQVNRGIASGQLGRGFIPVGQPVPFNPASVNVIVDTRRRNLSEFNADGLDLSTQYDFKAGENRFFVGLNGTYVLSQDQRVTSTAAETETVDTIYNNPNWRARAFVGWQRGGLSTNLFVNRTDSYVDNRFVTRPSIDAFTTVDARIAYDFSQRFTSGVLSGFSIGLSAQNVLDEDPPKVTVVANTTDTGYDPTNANPLGRFISLELSKTW